MSRLTALALAISLLSGCAFWPKLESSSKLKDGAETVNCNTEDVSVAIQCAHLTYDEVSAMLGDAGDYKRGSGYTAWTLATAGAGIAAYDGGTGVLKGVALTTGGLLGMSSTVGADRQRRILKEGQTQIACVIDAAYAVKGMPEAIADKFSKAVGAPGLTTATIPNKIATAQPASLRASALAGGNAKDKLQIYLEKEKFEKYYELSRLSLSSLVSAQSTNSRLGHEVASMIKAIRSDIQFKLDGGADANDESIKEQQNRIVALTGELIQKRGELREKLKDLESSTDQTDLAVKALASAYVEETSGVAEVLKRCIGHSTTEAIEGS